MNMTLEERKNKMKWNVPNILTMIRMFLTPVVVVLFLVNIPNGIGVLSLATAVGITASNGEARRLIAQGGISLDDNKVEDVNMIVSTDKPVIVKKGKKIHLKVVFK